MTFPDRMACVLLCAGRSSRFEGGAKLGAALGGKAVGQHMVDLLAAMPFVLRVAVVAAKGFRPKCSAFTVIEIDDPAVAMGHSLAAGMRSIMSDDVDAVMVVLADMPLVLAQHIARLLAEFQKTGGIVASTDGVTPMPPVIFSAAYFGEILASEGDTGARRLLGQASLVQAASDELLDIDTIDHLQRANVLLWRK